MNDGRIVLCVVSVVATDYHCFRLHRILYNVLHSSDCSWVPSLLSVARIFVNYGTHCTFGYSAVCITALCTNWLFDGVSTVLESRNFVSGLGKMTLVTNLCDCSH